LDLGGEIELVENLETKKEGFPMWGSSAGAELPAPKLPRSWIDGYELRIYK
jgi:hypothetical protein